MDRSNKKADRKHPQHKDNPPKTANPDPITGAPGSHPVGTGIGSAAAAAAGAGIGALGGPAGALVGGAVGAVAGGIAGKVGAEAINPTLEDAFWRENYAKRPYVREGDTYDVYRPSYEFGWTSRALYRDRRFDEVEPDLRAEWERKGMHSQMSWDRARHGIRDAWDRIDRPGAFGA